MTDWQPIEDAPKDGTWVLVYADGVQVVAKYVWDDNWHWATHLDNSNGLKVHQTCKPTHWMPLPAAPEPPK